MAETRITIMANAVRPEGEHVLTVGAGISRGLTLTFNGPMSSKMAEVAGPEGHAWLLSADDARAIIDAMSQHLAAA